jgi:hypothetical protein
LAAETRSQKREKHRGASIHTRISNTNSNISSLKRAAVEGQCLLQSIPGSKFCISKSLWLHFELVLDDSDVCAFTACKEIGDIANCSIEGKVAEMDSVGWLVWQRKLLTDGVT